MSLFHPRNRHQGRYDFPKLLEASPRLSRFVIQTPRGEDSIPFADEDAVKALNQALLASFYGIQGWDIPEGYLCPAIPGRSDYLHYLADLLADSHEGEIPRGDGVRVLDVGVGSSCVYPLIGRGEYGWSFVGADIDTAALESSAKILRSNPKIQEGVELRKQVVHRSVLRGVVRAGEKFDAVICNPPFHSSQAEALAGSARKWRNLGRGKSQHLNFGGQAAELWCPGGEVAFAQKMIEESVGFGKEIRWFTILISKESHLQTLYAALERADIEEYRTIDMAQGQKISRFLAWSFQKDA